jgi:predicted TIM-barrel fold metal-dependent hydrolase
MRLQNSDTQYRGAATMNKPAVIVTVSALLVLSHAYADGGHDPIGEQISKLPVFDAHMHYNDEAWGPVPPKAVLKLMDDSGVSMALVSSTPDEGTVRLLEFAPNRIVPEIRPYHGDVDSGNWTRAPGIFDYLAQRLADHPHEGIGEFHLHDVTIEDEPLLRRIADIAAKHDLLIHVHSDKAPVDLLYAMRPDLRILWAHAGMVEPAEVIEAMMAKYDSLYADTSYRESDIMNADGSIDPGWRRVIERFPDRFMVGSDTWTNSQWAEYRELIETNRQWLSRFSRPIAERIAYKNAERLFGRRLDNSLLGTR